MTVPIAAVTVTASYLAPDGSAAVGTVSFVPSATGATPGYLLATAVTVTLVDGDLSVELYATDDPDWIAPGWTYRVTERIAGARPRSYDISVPSASATLDLALVAPVVPVDTVTPYVLETRIGAPLGVASLDALGQVPLSQLDNAPAGGGGGGAVDSVFGRTGVVTAQTGDYTKTQVGLSNVDNTSDAAKPVSTAQATADTAIGTAAAGALTAHNAATTSVHGIANTALLATTAAVAAAYQPLDADLTTIAGLTATTGNTLQSTGSAWASRTPAQVKTALALDSVDNTTDAGKPVSTATQTALNLKADLAGPTFTGVPAAPTASAATSTTQLATTAFVTTADNLKAPLASPAFTGAPSLPTGATAVTQSAGNSTTALATTAFVTTADALKADLASPTFTGVPAAPTASAATSTTQLATTAFVTTADALKANLAGPTFTGVPAAPTAAQGVNTTQLATTAYVQTEAGLLVPKSLYTTKGDLAVATGASTPARLAVGADTFVLTADSTQTAGVKWAAAAGGSGTDYKVGATPKTGQWYRGNYGPVGSNLTLAINRLYAVPFRLNASTTFDRIGIDVATAAAAGGVARLGIFASDAAGALPGTLILDAGTVAIDTTGGKSITISQLLAAGVYWLAVVEQTATGAALRAIVSYDPLIPYPTGASMFTGTAAPGGVSSGVTSFSGALSSSPAISDNDNGPIIGLRAA